jgi:hypothetical protein
MGTIATKVKYNFLIPNIKRIAQNKFLKRINLSDCYCFLGLCCQDIDMKLSEEAKEFAKDSEGTYSIQKTSSNGKVVYKNNVTGMYLSWNAKNLGFWMVI